MTLEEIVALKVKATPSCADAPSAGDAAIAALRLAEPALRDLRDRHCDCPDCKYTLALNAIVAVLK